MPEGQMSTRPKDAEVEYDPAEVLMQQMGKSLKDKLAAVQAAKKGDFKDLDADFWKAEKNGDTIKGIYAGRQAGKKYVVHSLIVTGDSGKPVVTRINGTAILSRKLRQIEPGTAVLIERTGEDKNADGDPVFLYEVTTLALP